MNEESAYVLTDKRMSIIRLKGIFYNTVVRPTMFYGSCALDKKTEHKTSVEDIVKMDEWNH